MARYNVYLPECYIFSLYTIRFYVLLSVTQHQHQLPLQLFWWSSYSNPVWCNDVLIPYHPSARQLHSWTLIKIVYIKSKFPCYIVVRIQLVASTLFACKKILYQHSTGEDIRMRLGQLTTILFSIWGLFNTLSQLHEAVISANMPYMVCYK